MNKKSVALQCLLWLAACIWFLSATWGIHRKTIKVFNTIASRRIRHGTMSEHVAIWALQNRPNLMCPKGSQRGTHILYVAPNHVTRTDPQVWHIRPSSIQCGLAAECPPIQFFEANCHLKRPLGNIGPMLRCTKLLGSVFEFSVNSLPRFSGW